MCAEENEENYELIAATAALHGLSLATCNERDFEDCGVTVINQFA